MNNKINWQCLLWVSCKIMSGDSINVSPKPSFLSVTRGEGEPVNLWSRRGSKEDGGGGLLSVKGESKPILQGSLQLKGRKSTTHHSGVEPHKQLYNQQNNIWGQPTFLDCRFFALSLSSISFLITAYALFFLLVGTSPVWGVWKHDIESDLAIVIIVVTVLIVIDLIVIIIIIVGLKIFLTADNLRDWSSGTCNLYTLRIFPSCADVFSHNFICSYYVTTNTKQMTLIVARSLCPYLRSSKIK